MKRAFILAISLGLTSAAQVMAEEPSTATPPAPAGVTAPAATTSAPAQQGTVVRAIITTGINQREPVDEVTEVGSDASTVYLFTELRGMQGEHITHRWEYNGQVVSEVGFDVKAQRWRVWSNKSLQPVFAGKWTVKVVNSAGDVLATREFQYGSK